MAVTSRRSRSKTGARHGLRWNFGEFRNGPCNLASPTLKEQSVTEALEGVYSLSYSVVIIIK
jgi:hypothetical protein